MNQSDHSVFGLRSGLLQLPGYEREVLVVLVFLAGEVVVEMMANEGSASLSYCTVLQSPTIIGDTDNVFKFLFLGVNFPVQLDSNTSPSPNE